MTQGITDSTGTETFTGAKVDACAMSLKKSTGFSRMSVTVICCVLGSSLQDNALMCTFCSCIDLLTRAHRKLATGCHIYVPFWKKVVTVFGFLRFLLPYFFACVTMNREA